MYWCNTRQVVVLSDFMTHATERTDSSLGVNIRCLTAKGLELIPYRPALEACDLRP